MYRNIPHLMVFSGFKSLKFGRIFLRGTWGDNYMFGSFTSGNVWKIFSFSILKISIVHKISAVPFKTKPCLIFSIVFVDKQLGALTMGLRRQWS